MMPFQKAVSKLNQLIEDPREREFLVCDLLGKLICERETCSGELFALYAMIRKKAFGDAWRVFLSDGFDPARIYNRNLRAAFLLLRRYVHTRPARARTCDFFKADPTDRYYFFPCVFAVALQVDAPLGLTSLEIPFDQYIELKHAIGSFVGESAFAPALVSPKLYSPSAFCGEIRDFERIRSCLDITEKAICSAKKQSLVPGFPAGPSLGFNLFNEELNRDYRMVFAILPLRAPVHVDTFAHAEEICTRASMGEVLPLRLNNLIGGRMRLHNTVPTSSIWVERSQVCINQPYPALGGFEYFLHGVFNFDQTYPEVWNAGVRE